MKSRREEASSPYGWERVGFIRSCMVPLCHSSAGLLAAPPQRLVAMCEQHRPYVYFIKVKWSLRCSVFAEGVCGRVSSSHAACSRRRTTLANRGTEKMAYFSKRCLVFYRDCVSFLANYINVVLHISWREAFEVKHSQNESAVKCRRACAVLEQRLRDSVLSTKTKDTTMEIKVTFLNYNCNLQALLLNDVKDIIGQHFTRILCIFFICLLSKITFFCLST